MEHRTIAIIETLVLIGIVGALLVCLILYGSGIGPISFLTGK